MLLLPDELLQPFQAKVKLVVPKDGGCRGDEVQHRRHLLPLHSPVVARRMSWSMIS